MKNKIIYHFSIVLLGILFYGCQNHTSETKQTTQKTTGFDESLFSLLSGTFTQSDTVNLKTEGDCSQIYINQKLNETVIEKHETSCGGYGLKSTSFLYQDNKLKLIYIGNEAPEDKYDSIKNEYLSKRIYHDEIINFSENGEINVYVRNYETENNGIAPQKSNKDFKLTSNEKTLKDYEALYKNLILDTRKK